MQSQSQWDSRATIIVSLPLVVLWGINILEYRTVLRDVSTSETIDTVRQLAERGLGRSIHSLSGYDVLQGDRSLDYYAVRDGTTVVFQASP